jgi:ornithine cyclodeaminase/alanine dehydrogenase-like protein (mu-crystallin family)
LTLVLSERDVASLLDMKEVVETVEQSFRKESEGQASNSPRTRTVVSGSALNVMHASLPYLGRAGVKCYLSSRAGTRFVFVLFDLSNAAPLAVMGADVLGRYRTGAAAAVATKFLLRDHGFQMAVFGSGKQALTQVTAMAEVASLKLVRVWSRDGSHSKKLAVQLREQGIDSTDAPTPGEAARGSEVGSAITSSETPFLHAETVGDLHHLNLSGSNRPTQAEADPQTVAGFQTIVVDDLRQAKVEAGDLIQAVGARTLDWERVVELKDVVAGRINAGPRTLFKSLGLALEDVAVASLVYDKALQSGDFTSSAELGA